MNRNVLLVLAGLALAGCMAGCCKEKKVAVTQEYGAESPPGVAMVDCAPTGAITTARTLPSDSAGCDVLRIEQSAPRQVIAGTTFDYSIKVTNISKARVEDVAITDAISGIKVVGSNPQATATGDTLRWDLGSLDGGAAKTLYVRGSADAAAKVRNCVNATFRAPAVCLMFEAVQPSLKLEKSGPDRASVCDPATYRIVVTNDGSTQVCNVVVTDTLAEGLTMVDGKRESRFNVGALAPGQSREFTVRARGERTGKFTNRATATADGGITASAESTTTFFKPSLVLTKTGPERLMIGKGSANATYEITIKNTGDGEVRNVILSERLPAGASMVASEPKMAAGREPSWSVGSLGPGESKTVSMTVSLSEPGTFRNVITARGDCAEATAEASTEVQGVPAVLLEAVDVEDPIAVNGNITYVITVTNQGYMEDKGIVVTATLPDEQEFSSADGPSKHTVDGRTIKFEPLASLAPKAKAVYRVMSKAAKAGDSRFRVELRTDWTKEPVIKTESTNIYAK